ncbi:MAG: aminotransferase class III-fold pyridoxal phosphate-dependent enzyme [Chitinophagales bacterium]|nr:aminotransferase class III-fold pyridoxal phosphate-dependent enzyme [Chitinophagales bacterium]
MLSQRQLFLSHVAQTSPAPLALEIERGEGVWLYAPDGKRYLDMISGISVSSLGHCHPAIVKAVQEQAARFMHLMVYGEFIHSPQVMLSQALAAVLPEQLQSVYLVNSGAEATEGAMKLAKRFTGRSEIVYFKGSYHGSTQGALSIMGDEYFKTAYRPLLPDTRQLRYGEIADLEQITPRTAAVFFEPVQAESGVKVPSTDYVKALRQRCLEVGALLVFDEIQTGFGRTGSLFRFQQLAVVPDVLLLAKAMGGGMPIGAFISSSHIMTCLQHSPVLGHITTFGGHAVSAAAALAALQTLNDSPFIQQVAEKEALLKTRLQHPAILSQHHAGLLMALEFADFETNKGIIDTCIENGLITDWFLFAPHCMRLAPPLTITVDELEAACDIILHSINQYLNLEQ